VRPTQPNQDENKTKEDFMSSVPKPQELIKHCIQKAKQIKLPKTEEVAFWDLCNE
jgi:hypothetical protein